MAVRLRPVAVDDVDHIMTWINDPEVTRNFAALSQPITRAQEIAFLEGVIASETERLYAIEDDAGKTIGTAGVHRIYWPARNGRVGIVIGERAARGRGLGTEVLRQLCQTGFGPLGLHKLWLVHYASNARMHHIAQKVGFVQEGVLRDEYFHEGVFHDLVRHAILAHEFAGTGNS